MRRTLWILLVLLTLASLQACAHVWTPAEMSIVSSGSAPAARPAAARAPGGVVVVPAAGPTIWYGNSWAGGGWGGGWGPAWRAGWAAGPVYHGPGWNGWGPGWRQPVYGWGGPTIHVGRTIRHHRTYRR